MTNREPVWESTNSLSPKAPDKLLTKMKFIELNLLQASTTGIEEIAFAREIQKANDLGLNSIPELPEGMKPSFGKRSFNTSEFIVISWSHYWDTEFDCDIIICELFYPKLERLETINAQYSKKEWIKLLAELGYE